MYSQHNKKNFLVFLHRGFLDSKKFSKKNPKKVKNFAGEKEKICMPTQLAFGKHRKIMAISLLLDCMCQLNMLLNWWCFKRVIKLCIFVQWPNKNYINFLFTFPVPSIVPTIEHVQPAYTYTDCFRGYYLLKHFILSIQIQIILTNNVLTIK